MRPFAMERWQSTHENRVAYNLSESGVHPLHMRELLELAPGDAPPLDLRLGYGQSNGSDELRDRIAQLYPGAGEAHVVATAGSAEANFVALWRLVRPGDEVAVVVPAYMQTYGLAESFDARVREIPLREDLDWQPDPDDIARAIGSHTRVVVVTNPNNPTGAALRDDARDALIAAADAAGAWILADEVYAGAEMHGPVTASFYGRYPRVVVTASLSKAFGLPGLRLGWAVAPPDLAADLWARTDYTSIAPAILSDHLACIALRPDVRDAIRRRTRAILHESFDFLAAWLDRVGVFHYRPPDAGAICFVRYDLPVDSLDFVERLRVDEDVLLVPGAHFGMGPFLRFGFGLHPATLDPALRAVGRLISRIRPS